MRIAFPLALALALLAAPPARADEGAPAAATRPAVVAPAPRAPDLRLEKVPVPERRAADAGRAAHAEWPARGSFWWMVGVIVVAGVILAVVLG